MEVIQHLKTSSVGFRNFDFLFLIFYFLVWGRQDTSTKFTPSLNSGQALSVLVVSLSNPVE